MADIFTPEKRRQIMRAVGSRDTKPEILLRKALFKMGYRFRLYRTDLPGSPDLVFPKYKAIIFVNGCFWHGHNCKRGNRIPATNSDYWRRKIERNRQNDRKALASLQQIGWRCLTVWECDVTPNNLQKLCNEISDWLILPNSTEV